jgi:hypothetical protein
VAPGLPAAVWTLATRDARLMRFRQPFDQVKRST